MASTATTTPATVSATPAPAPAPKAKAKAKATGKKATPAPKAKAAPEPTNNRGTPAVGPVAKARKYTVGGLDVAIEPTANGNRYTVGGHTLCGLFRWCGANGYTAKQVTTLLAGLKLAGVVSASTVGCQVGSARAEAKGKVPHHPGKAAELNRVQAAAVKKLVG